jgi:hypothetical protein
MKKLLLILLCIPIIGFGQDDCGNEPKYTGFKFGNYKTTQKYLEYKKEFEKWEACKAYYRISNQKINKQEIDKYRSNSLNLRIEALKSNNHFNLFKLDSDGIFDFHNLVLSKDSIIGYDKYTLERNKKNLQMSEVGCVNGDCINGFGTYVWPSGSKYVGEFMNKLCHGKGTYNWFMGAVYKGEYFLNLRHGKGTYSYGNGIRFSGEYKMGNRDGFGTLTIPNFFTYEGGFKNDSFSGKGKIIFNNNEIIEGYFVGGELIEVY